MSLSTNDNDNVEFRITPTSTGVKISLSFKNRIFHVANYNPGKQFEMFDVFGNEHISFKQHENDYFLKLKDVTVKKNYDFCSFFIGFVSFLFTQIQMNLHFQSSQDVSVQDDDFKPATLSPPSGYVFVDDSSNVSTGINSNGSRIAFSLGSVERNTSYGYVHPSGRYSPIYTLDGFPKCNKFKTKFIFNGNSHSYIFIDRANIIFDVKTCKYLDCYNLKGSSNSAL